ncbi:uncharacterized protein EV420DRAFT_1750874 [Desarmillaria tabescens]|uniref:Uncharacterized protein n=1 Tax=Armillaria tabescens TaxID=1929756 RepID=A0AA39MW43_ARMTA|nr:uncharacterized protein EV420DRAFT_1750874 [Desarmillaria tabescens]KAK0448398.1 hypothetical protein EV420DRAFT_1750874 [Desarmillaria tabescens]
MLIGVMVVGYKLSTKSSSSLEKEMDVCGPEGPQVLQSENKFVWRWMENSILEAERKVPFDLGSLRMAKPLEDRSGDDDERNLSHDAGIECKRRKVILEDGGTLVRGGSERKARVQEHRVRAWCLFPLKKYLENEMRISVQLKIEESVGQNVRHSYPGYHLSTFVPSGDTCGDIDELACSAGICWPSIHRFRKGYVCFTAAYGGG